MLILIFLKNILYNILILQLVLRCCCCSYYAEDVIHTNLGLQFTFAFNKISCLNWSYSLISQIVLSWSPSGRLSVQRCRTGCCAFEYQITEAVWPLKWGKCGKMWPAVTGKLIILEKGFNYIFTGHDISPALSFLFKAIWPTCMAWCWTLTWTATRSLLAIL